MEVEEAGKRQSRYWNPDVSISKLLFHTRTHLLSRTSCRTLSYKPNWGWQEIQKGQTEDKTCIKLGPGRLGAQMETHQHPPPPVRLLYTEATWGGEAFLRGMGVTPWSSGTGGTCDSFSLNTNVLGKTAVLHLAHFCSWGCANQVCNY
jgi:hypothetical protein